MSYIPAPKADVEAQKLMDALIQVTEDHQIDSVTLRRLEIQANQLLKNNAQVAHVGLGAIAALRFDVAKVHHHFRVAGKIPGNNRNVLVNYAVALQLVEEPEAALQRLQEVLQQDPGNPELLESALLRAMDAGRFRDAHEYCHRYNAAVPKAPNENTGLVKGITQALDEQVFTEVAVKRLMALGCQIQKTHNMHRKAATLFRDRDAEFAFSMQKLIWTTPDHAADMTWQLAEAWAEDEELVDDPGFHLTLSYMALESP